ASTRLPEFTLSAAGSGREGAVMGDREPVPPGPQPRDPWESAGRIEEIERIVEGVVATSVERPQDREEAAAELLAHGLKGLASGECPGPASGPLLRTWVGWRCKDWLRRERVRRDKFRSLNRYPGVEPAAPQAPSPLRSRDLSCILLWVEELSNERWKVEVRMRYFARLKSTEIAGRLGLAPGTVRADLNHARAEIRRRHAAEGLRLLEGEEIE
ncbi:MAG: sigma-70 family RNA polymerase sigma factor, partial [Planctomycetota bacterium]